MELQEMLEKLELERADKSLKMRLKRLYRAAKRTVCDVPNIPYKIQLACKRLHFVDTKLTRWTYHEVDTRLECAIINLFMDFYEKEAIAPALWDAKEKGEKPKDVVILVLEYMMEHSSEEIYLYGLWGSNPTPSQVKAFKERKTAYNKMRGAYMYFKQERPARLAEIEELQKRPYKETKWNNVFRQEDTIRKLDTKHLCNIVETRQYLWT